MIATPTTRPSSYAWRILAGWCLLGWMLLGLMPKVWERFDLMWFDFCTLARAHASGNHSVDPRLVVIGISSTDLGPTDDLTQEYQSVAEATRLAKSLGASVIGWDAVFHRGTPAAAQPLIETFVSNGPVVLGEILRHAQGGRADVSFPFQDTAYQPSGCLDVFKLIVHK